MLLVSEIFALLVYAICILLFVLVITCEWARIIETHQTVSTYAAKKAAQPSEECQNLCGRCSALRKICSPHVAGTGTEDPT